MNTDAKRLSGELSRIRAKLTSHDIRKKELIDEIKAYYGSECIEDETKTFNKQNIIIFKCNDIEIILYFHYSSELGFFGCDVGYVDRIAAYITDNPSKKIYSYIYLILNDNELGKVNFAFPVFYVKTHQSDISKSEYPQYKFNILYKNGIYWLRLKNNQLEDISSLISDINNLLSEKLMRIHDEEKEKYVNKAEAQMALLKKFGKL